MEKLCLILLQIDVKSYWRFCKKVDKDACIYGKLSCSFTADLVKMDGIVVSYPIQFPLEFHRKINTSS